MNKFCNTALFIIALLFCDQVMAEPLNHKKIVKNAFKQWSLGTGTPFELLAAEAMLVNGNLYRNSYAWFFTIHKEQIINVRAVLDLNAFDAVMAIDI